jgi:hypothetical protein
MPEPLKQKLATLKTDLVDARLHREELQRIADHERFTGPDIPEANALSEYHNGVNNRVPGFAPDPGRARALECALAARLAQDADIGIESLPALGRNTFRLTHHRAAREAEEARQAERDAGRIVADFIEIHRDELEALEEEAERQRISDAIESGSADKIRAALGFKGKALTTANLAG